MKSEQLFRVLVMGGSLITANGAYAQQTIQNLVSEERATPVFCDSDPKAYCEQKADGTWGAKAGLECCWGTSCEPKDGLEGCWG